MADGESPIFHGGTNGFDIDESEDMEDDDCEKTGEYTKEKKTPTTSKKGKVGMEYGF